MATELGVPFEVRGRSTDKLRQGFAALPRDMASEAGKAGQKARQERMRAGLEARRVAVEKARRDAEAAGKSRKEIKAAVKQAQESTKVWTGGFKKGEPYTSEMAKFAINERWRKYYEKKAKELEKTLAFDEEKKLTDLELARLKIQTEVVPVKNQAKSLARSIERAGSEARRVSGLIGRLAKYADEMREAALKAPEGFVGIPRTPPPFPRLPGGEESAEAVAAAAALAKRRPMTSEEQVIVAEAMKQANEARATLNRLRQEGVYVDVIDPKFMVPGKPAEPMVAHKETVGGVTVDVVETESEALAALIPKPSATEAPSQERTRTARSPRKTRAAASPESEPEPVPEASSKEEKKELTRAEKKKLVSSLERQVEEDFNKSPTFQIQPREKRKSAIRAKVNEILINDYGINRESEGLSEISESSSQSSWLAAAAIVALIPSFGSVMKLARAIDARAFLYRSGMLDPMILSVDVASSPSVQRALASARRSLGLP